MEQTEKKYWGSIEELERLPSYTESLGREFVSPPEEQTVTEMDFHGLARGNLPSEHSEREGEAPPALPVEGATRAPVIERRDFLKVMGAGILLATTACSRRPVEKIVPYVNKPEEIVPGVADYYASTCFECAASCGLLVKTREGRPIKLEGNDLHPLNHGRLCARGQASLLNLYDPDRLKNPVKVDRGSGSTQPLSWIEADEQIKNSIVEAKNNGAKIYLLTGTVTSPSTRRLISDFIASVGSSFATSLNPAQKLANRTESVTDHLAGGPAAHVEFDAVVPEEVALGQEMSYGQKVTPRFRFDKAEMIVSFGADFLGTWLSPVEFANRFSRGRQVEKGKPPGGKMSQLVVFESALSLTGSNADEYHPLKPGDELSVALALAHEFIVKRGLSSFAGRPDGTQALNGYDIETVARETGLNPDDLRKTAERLWKSRGKGIVLGGAVKSANAVALQVAVNVLNSALENDGATIDYSAAPSSQANSSFAALKDLIAEMNRGNVGVLFIYNTNPLYSLPHSLEFSAALKKVKTVVNIADQLNETAVESDFVCPPPHYLEAWNDASPQKGLTSIAQPVINPLYDTRSFQDSLIQWGNLPGGSAYDYLRNFWKEEIYAESGVTASFEVFWEETLKKGVFETALPNAEADRLAPARDVAAEVLSSLPRRKSSAGLGLTLYPTVALFDGRSANNAWLQELPDPLSKITWDNYLSMAPATAKELALKEGDVVHLKGNRFDIKLPVHIQPKMHPKSLMAAIGYGRKNAGPVGNNVGVDLTSAQSVDDGSPNGGLLRWGAIPVETIVKTGVRVRLATTQGHHTVEGRPIVKETTFAEFKKNPHAAGTEMEAIPTMWPKHEYKGYRWGMAIDTNSCIGCNACMTACQSENNIPTVGKDQVLKGRDMHWIRVDRYYGGGMDQPEVNFQPMLCQQCENAPCETVCPVLATVHTDDGLNAQIYNRCVGTRYCSNNCPYKVRRYNFLDFRKGLPQPLDLVLNPDVTVRERGVMEKCTFCVQRIRGAKDKAKDEGRNVRDGEVLTACQQTCPADAIVFGDLNDPNSLVSKLKKSPRGYHVLEDLNVGPQVTYLAKIRNV